MDLQIDALREDGSINRSVNSNFIANIIDITPKLDYNPYILTSSSTSVCANTAYQPTAVTSTIDAQTRSLINTPKTVISNRANSSIVLITTKPNQPEGSKLIHFNSSSTNTLSKSNLALFNTVHKTTTETSFSSLQKQANLISADQKQPKTATILVSKSKTKTGLPLLLRKSK